MSSLFYFRMEGNYEKELFSSIKKNIDRKIDINDTEDSTVIKVMQNCNSLLSSRAAAFKDDDLEGIKVDYMHPATVDLMTARGACGSYSLILARLLQNYHLDVRIGQMKAHGLFGAHNITEVRIRDKWVVLDPTFNIYFVTPDNQLAGFTDISKSWNYYARQVPQGYDTTYRYEDVRYTNWAKIPVLSPVIKKALDLLAGKERSGAFCARILFLRVYDVYFYCTLMLLIPLFLLTAKIIIKTKIFPRYDIPFTFSNIFKYIKIRLSGNALHTGVNT